MVIAICCDKRTTVELSDTSPDGGVFREDGGITPPWHGYRQQIDDSAAAKGEVDEYVLVRYVRGTYKHYRMGSQKVGVDELIQLGCRKGN